MQLLSPLLLGDERIEQAASGGPSIKPRPVVEPIESIRRIQLALQELSYVFFDSFSDDLPDGIYGPDTHAAVVDFQRASFKYQPAEWDGHLGPNTLAKLDAALLYVATTPDTLRLSRRPTSKPAPPPRHNKSKKIVVDTSAQTLNAFIGTLCIYDWDCVCGDSDHPTDPGVHTIFRKQHPCRSKPYNVQMNYAQFFTNDGKAIHQYHGITPLGILRVVKKGTDWIGSHGCVRLTGTHAKTLYEWTPAIGTKVDVVPHKKK
jgi:hypothetical protein